MRIVAYKWNVRVIGEHKPYNYCGYKTKKEALAFANAWNSLHESQVEVCKYDDSLRKWVLA